MSVDNCPSCGTILDDNAACPACLMKLAASAAGPSADPGSALPTVDQLDQLFPQLEVTRLIGRGGMGAIYHARQTALDREVAVKLIARELSRDTAFLDRFEREAKALAKLSHPNVVTVYDYGHTDDGQAYLIMEYIDGTNLRDLISTSPVSRDDALELVSNTCLALEYAHSKGVVHRDIKPENILLSNEGAVKIADFGIAKIVDESIKTPTLTATRQVLGSLHYLAPEHMESPDQVDHRVDLYALGVVLYELLTGKLPLGRFEPASSLSEQSTPVIDEIIHKAMSRKPSERYQSAAELAEAVDSVRAAVARTGSTSVESLSGQNVSVPFTADTLSGFAEAVGMLHSNGKVFTAEFRMRDSIWGGIKSQTQAVEIPVENITRLELRPSAFKAKLAISTQTISQLGAMPNAENGLVELKIKRSDTPHAKQLVQSLGFATKLPKHYGTSDGNENNRQLFAIMMFVFALVNIGMLAAVEALVATAHTGGVTVVIMAVMAAVIFTPIFTVQIIAGFCNLLARPKGISIAATWMSMLPFSPAWPLSFPFAIWARRWLIERPAKPLGVQAGGQTGARSWGATTMMWVREKRWTRVFATLNILALVVVAAGLVGYKMGYVPSSVDFRVVSINGEEVDTGVLRDALRARLSSDQFSVMASYGSEPRVTISGYGKDLPIMREMLRIAQGIEVVWLLPDESPESATPESDSAEALPTNEVDKAAKRLKYLPVVDGVLPSEVSSALNVTDDRLGKEFEVRDQPIRLDASLVTNAVMGKIGDGAQELVVTLSPEGRRKMRDSLPANHLGLGIVIEEMVYGFASRDAIDNQTIVFSLPIAAQFTRTEILSAIRGPNINARLVDADSYAQ